MTTDARLMSRVVSGVVVLVAMAGCSSDKDPFKEWDAAQKYHDYVPATARTVAQGTGLLSFTAPANGIVYLVDTSAMNTIKGVQKPSALVSGYVRTGTEVFFDPTTKRAYTKGRQGAHLTNVVAGHNYELRFDPIDKTK